MEAFLPINIGRDDMAESEPKKLALIRIWQILQKHSDRDHLLTQDKIREYLEDEYSIALERKAVSRNLNLLREAEIDIKSGTGGIYLDERLLEESEIRMLIDGILLSRHIAPHQSKDMIEKLCQIPSENFESRIRSIRSVDAWNKTDNQQTFLNIDLIDEAIAKKIKIQYDYYKHGIDRQLHKSSTHTVTPYEMLLHNQRYYLMAFSDRWEHMIFHRLDHIQNIKLLKEQEGRKLEDIPGYEDGIDYKALSTKLPYMYTDKPEQITFVADAVIMDQIIDWFGKDIVCNKMKGDEDKVQVSIVASPMAMEHWAMQYVNHVEIKTPVALRDRIKEILADAVEKYE